MPRPSPRFDRDGHPGPLQPPEMPTDPPLLAVSRSLPEIPVGRDEGCRIRLSSAIGHLSARTAVARPASLASAFRQVLWAWQRPPPSSPRPTNAQVRTLRAGGTGLLQRFDRRPAAGGPGLPKTQRPRLILLDVLRSGMDGIELMGQGPELGDLTINCEEHRVTVGGRAVALTAKEFDLLRVLSVNAARGIDVDVREPAAPGVERAGQRLAGDD